MKSLAAKTLLDMAEAKDGRSLASRIRDLYPEIDKAIQAGVKREAILDVLHKDGLTVTMKTFESVLYRIRLKKRSQGIIPENVQNEKKADVANEKSPKNVDDRKPITPRDFIKIRADVDNMDLRELLKPVKRK